MVTMSSTTIVFGMLLTLLGLAGYFSHRRQQLYGADSGDLRRPAAGARVPCPL